MSILYTEKDNIGYVTFDQPDAKVNVLTAQVIYKLDEIVGSLAGKTDLKAIVFQSAKKDCFVAGADINEIEKLTQVADAKKAAQAGQFLFNKIEDLKVPTVAVIDGVALGGGCELILACRWRLATFNDKVKIGLPEVNLGFVPGFGGTYRLPRTVGLQESLKMILSGSMVSGNAAYRIGLVDHLVPQAGLSQSIVEFVESIQGKKRRLPIKPKKGFERFLDANGIGNAIVFHQSRKSVLEKTKGFYPAPLRAIDVIRKSGGLPRERALDMESTAFGELAVTDTSKNLVKLFFLTEKFKKYQFPGTENIKPASIEKAAVIGAGIMGGGIAQLFSNRGVWTRLKDISYDAIAKGFAAAFKVYNGDLKRRKIKPHELREKMARITSTMDYKGFNDLDIVIEAVVENMDVKKKVFKELSEVVGEKTILASNTSSLSVTEMASVTENPSKVVGFHFFNPVHRMPLIEIIRTSQTSMETIATAVDFAKKLGKTPIVVKDAPGFLVNRILLIYVNEAGRLMEEGGGIEEIDKTMTDFGMPMGPFTLADEVGNDVGVKVLHILHDGLGSRYKPVGVFEKVYEKKYLGKKSGKGFYVHAKQRFANREVETMRGGAERRAFNRDEALRRMVYIMINEAAMCLQEGVIEDAATVDIGMIMGTGFPFFRGGLLRYADAVGIDNLVQTLEDLDAVFKDGRFKPASCLLDLKAKKKGFYS